MSLAINVPWLVSIGLFTVFVLTLWALLRCWCSTKPELLGGTRIRGILDTVQILQDMQLTPGLFCFGDFVMLIQLFETWWIKRQHRLGRCPYKFVRERFVVELDGAYRDSVAIEWLTRPEQVEDDAPIIIIVPALCCDANHLPGNSVYQVLLQRTCRVGVFLKRGVAYILSAPAFHLFGHPSDLQAVLSIVASRHPKAPIHLISFSGGNGLVGNHAILHAGETPAIKSCLLMFSGSDYNAVCCNSRSRWRSTSLILDVVLLRDLKRHFLEYNRDILQQHNANGYSAALQSRSFQELHNVVVRYFSGYTPSEADSRTHGFAGGPIKFADVRVPILWVTCKDDPLLPGGPNEAWCGVIKQLPLLALALFRHGSHCAAFESLRLKHWSDRLVAQWMDAMLAASAEHHGTENGSARLLAAQVLGKPPLPPRQATPVAPEYLPGTVTEEGSHVLS